MGAAPRSKIITDTDVLKILVGTNFPSDPCFDIVLKRHSNLSVTVDSDNGIGSVAINVTPQTGLSVYQSQGKNQRPVASLFTENHEGQTLALYDLDMDGQWDVKKTPTMDVKCSIWIDTQWLEVDSIQDLMSSNVKAIKGNSEFEFHGSWKKIATGR
ncbi:MAG TPA: hypothetical protein VFE24_07500 [Pirellulales bacterium]|jgi:hypothetical protein|nr:hypothetical protein [Pirellulales bacterium]